MGTQKKPRPPHIDDKYAVSYTTYVNHGCRCEGCAADHRAKHKQWRDGASREMRRRLNKRATEYRKRLVEEQRPGLANNGKPWTDEEKQIAWDRSISVRQASEILGRTIYAVRYMRSLGPSGST